MKVLVFTDKKSQYNDSFKQLMRQLKSNRTKIESYELVSTKGQAQARLYDVMSAPAVVLVRNDGAPVASWRHSIPTADEVQFNLGYV